MDSTLDVKPAPDTTSTPASSTTSPRAPIWQTTFNMTCAASGGWNTGPWGSLAASSSDFDMPAPGMASTPLLGKYSLVMSERQQHALKLLAIIVVWGVLILGVLQAHPSNDKQTVVVEEATVAVKDGDAATLENVMGVQEIDALLALIKANSRKKSFLASFGRKEKVARRHSVGFEGDASDIAELINRRNSAPAAPTTPLSSLLYHRIRTATMTKEDQVRSESN